ncbi:unnamed protein product [Ambrosiozyma monospora]|uniref:Unnamed protein product n=1 Tax=Ambrosiozyma monospora TaxID=43982 RepID=A0A9W6Z6F4_AMBMO|nr:unnamed protein product [Ambrosiozyma monospora]
MSFERKPKSKVILSYDYDESSDDELQLLNKKPTFKRQSESKFKRSKAIDSHPASHRRRQLINENEDDDDEDDDEQQSIPLFKFKKRFGSPAVTGKQQETEKSVSVEQVLNRYGSISTDTQKSEELKNEDEMDIDIREEDDKEEKEYEQNVSKKPTRSVKDVLSQYGSISTEIPEEKKPENREVQNLDSIEENEDDDEIIEIVSPDNDSNSPMEIKDTVPTILDSFQVKELKDRRYRAQLASQQLKPDIELEPDFVEEYSHRKDNNDDDVIVLDQDEKLTDGRLAIGENEVNLQQKLQKMEIEEALFNYSNSSSDSDIDIIHINRLNKDSVHRPQKSSSVVFTLPRVQKPMPVYSHELENVKKEAVLINKLLLLNRQRHIDIRKRLETLKNDANAGCELL